MNQRDDLDRVLSAWSDDAWAPPAPTYLDKVLARTRHTQQRPAWTSLERWLPMAVITAPRATSAPIRLAWILLVLLLALSIAAGGLIVGARLFSATTPIPMGGAAVLAFDLNGDLFTIRADGTDRQQLTSGSEQDALPVWSPDGKLIAFRRGDSSHTSIAVIDATGGTPRTLYTTASTKSGECFPHAPAWSPDSTWLVFPGDDCSGLTDLYVAPADASMPAQTFLTPGTVGTAPAWTATPGGSSIAFVGRDADGEGIFVADIDPDRRIYADPPFVARRVSEPDSTLSWAGTNNTPLTAPSWSRDATAVAAAAGTSTDCRFPGSGSMDAFVIKVYPVRQSAVGPGDAKEYNPVWSPDGQHLALQRIVDPSRYVDGRPCTMTVWITDADGADGRELQTLATDDSQPPLWSPDGSRIVGNMVRMVGAVEHYDLYVETIDGSSPVMTIADGDYATWQPATP